MNTDKASTYFSSPNSLLYYPNVYAHFNENRDAPISQIKLLIDVVFFRPFEEVLIQLLGARE